MNRIRTTDMAGIDGIINGGKSGGYWIARIEPYRGFYVGVVTGESINTEKFGTFGEVIEWLHRKSGILRDERRDRVIRDSSDTFRGIRVTSDAVSRMPERDTERAKVYTGFACRTDRGKRGLRTPAHDGMRHGNALPVHPGPDNAQRKEQAERDAQILRLSREGLIQREIAERLGISDKTASSSVRRMRKNGVDVPHVADDRVAARRREKAEQFRRLQEGGMRVTEIARREGVSPQAIYAAMKQDG